MTLRATIQERRRRGMAVENVERTMRVERRADEIATVAEVETDYQRVDRAGDLQMESWFQRHYAAQTSNDGRTEVAEGFAIWQRTERAEDHVIGGSVDGALNTLRANNPFWLGEQA